MPFLRVLPLALFILAACSSAPRPAPEPIPERTPEPNLEETTATEDKPVAPRSAVRVRPRIDADVVAEAGRPLRLPMSARQSAPWLEPVLARGNHPQINRRDVASGMQTAVLSTTQGQHIAFHRSTGVLGLLEVPPNNRWFGFGKDDQLIAADNAGQVFAATSLTTWNKLGLVEGATLWDSAAGILAASDGTQVWVSVDGGKSFAKPYRSRRTVKRVLVRSPSTVVLEIAGRVRSRVLISRDGGKRFRASKLRPKKLARNGAWIWNANHACPAVLSSDSQTWVEPRSEQFERFYGANWWTGFGDLHTWFFSGTPSNTKWLTPAYPLVPTITSAERRIRGAKSCSKKQLEGGGVMGGVMGGVVGGMLGGVGGGCEGAICLRYQTRMVAIAGQNSSYLFTDAECKALPKGGCDTESVPLRPPHVAVVNGATGMISKIGEIPKGCLPRNITSIRGISLLVCDKSGKSEVWASDQSGNWSREYIAAFEPNRIFHADVAPDGTLVIAHKCGIKAKACAASVRRPVAVGEKDAWFDLTTQGGLAYRAVVGGRAAIVSLVDEAILVSLASADDLAYLTQPFQPPKQAMHGVDIDQLGRIVFSIGMGGGAMSREGEILDY